MTRERVAKPFPWRCPTCLKCEVRPSVLNQYSAKAKYDGRVYDVTIGSLTVARCDACGEVVFTIETDEQINRALRDELRLLQPEQIRALRAGRFTQEELADLLGTAAETISRWETGAMIQSRAMDQFLRAFAAVPDVEQALRNPQIMAPWKNWTSAFSNIPAAVVETGSLAGPEAWCPSACVWADPSDSSGAPTSTAPRETAYLLAA